MRGNGRSSSSLNKVEKMINPNLVVWGKSAFKLNISAFNDAADMVKWEMSAYDAYGQARCDRESVWTLSDLFGEDFNTAFRRRHNFLLAQHHLVGLRKERDELDKIIAEKEAIVTSYLRDSTIGDVNVKQ